MDSRLSALLSVECAHLSADQGKVICKLNGHSMPARYEVVAAFVK